MSRLQRADSRESVFSVSSCVSGIGSWQVGDRVRTGGRPGTIAFIGTTKFAPGEWIGLVLDEKFGKNDGSVAGNRYFECTPEHGLFVKSSKIERIVMSPSRFKSPTPGSMTGGEEPVSQYSVEFGVDIGDRVIAPGGKTGSLRYLETVDFAQGVWAGVELDQPLGKNDGSVQGKRYFTCKPMHGIFASAAKIERAPSQAPPKMMVHHTKTSLLRQQNRLGGSRESLNSIGRMSMASSRFGVVPRPAGSRSNVPVSAADTSTIKALQAALQEKETHLTQMMAERDIERNEMIELARRCEQLEHGGGGSGTTATTESAVDAKYKSLSDKFDTQRAELLQKRKQVEEMEFQLEEMQAMKDVADEEQAQVQSAVVTQTIPEERVVVQMSDEDTARMSSMTVELTELKTQLEAVNSLMSKKEKDLKAEIDRLNGVINESAGSAAAGSAASAAEMTKMREDLAATVTELDSVRDSLLNEQNNLKKSESSFQEMKAQFEKELNVLVADKASLDESCALETKKREALEAEAVALKSSLSERTAETVRIKDELAKCESSLTEQKSLVASLSSEQGSAAASLQERISALESEKKLTEDANRSLEAAKVELEQSLKKKEDALAEVEKKSEACNNEISTLKESASKMSSELETARSQLASQRSELDKQLAEAAEHQKQWKISREELDERIASLQVNLKISEDEKAATVATENELQEQLKALGDKQHDSDIQLSARSTELENLTRELEQLKADSSKGQFDWQNEKKTMVETHSALVTDFETRLAASTAEVAQLTDQLAAVTADSKKAAEELEELRKRLTDEESSHEEKIRELTAKHSQAEQQVADELAASKLSFENLEDTHTSTQRSLNSANEDLAKEREDIQRLSSELAEKTEEAAKALAVSQSLQTELRTAQDQYTSLQSSMESFKLGEDCMANDLAAARTECAEQKAEAERHARRVEELSSQLTSLTSELDSAKKSLEETGDRLKTSEVEKEDSIRKLERSLANETTVRSKLENDIRSKVDEIATLNTRIEQLLSGGSDKDSLLGDLTAQLAKKDADIESGLSNVKSLEEKLAESASHAADKDKKLKEIKEELSKLNEQIAESSSATVALQSQLAETKEKLESADSRLAETTAQLAAATSELSTKQSSGSELEQALAEAKKTIEQKKHEIAASTNKSVELEAEIADMKCKMEAAVNLSAERADEITQLNTEKSAVSAELETVRQELTSVKALCEERSRLAEQLEAEKTSREKELEVANVERNRLSKEITLNVEDLQKLKSDHEVSAKKADELAQVKKELETLRGEMESMTAQAETERQESQNKAVALESVLAELRDKHKADLVAHELATTSWMNEKTRLSEEVSQLSARLEGESAHEEKLSSKLTAALHRITELTANEASTSTELASKAEKLSLLEQQLVESTGSISRLSEELDQLRRTIEKEKENQKVEEVEAAGLQSAQMASEFAEAMEKVRVLSEEKTALERLLVERQTELDQLAVSAGSAQSEADESVRQKLAAFTELEAHMMKKNVALTEKVEELTGELEKARERTQTDETRSQKQQIDFLNSIIADQHSKEAVLKEQIARLQNPADDGLLNDRLFGSSESKAPPPRVYCDICEEFDLHDTDDCPTQAMDVAESAQHSHFSPEGKKQKPPPRKYCDHCEEFDHDTDECPIHKKKKKEYTF